MSKMNLKNLRNKRGVVEEFLLFCSAIFMVVSMVTLHIMWNKTSEKNKMWKLNSNNNTPQLSEKERLLEQILHENDPEVIHQLSQIVDKKNSENPSEPPRSESKDSCPKSFN